VTIWQKCMNCYGLGGLCDGMSWKPATVCCICRGLGKVSVLVLPETANKVNGALWLRIRWSQWLKDHSLPEGFSQRDVDDTFAAFADSVWREYSDKFGDML
jgi:hypothetical protein